MTQINPMLLILFVLLCIIAVYKSIRQPVDEALPVSDRAFKPLFFVVLFLGLAVRLYQFGEVPCGIKEDEAMAAINAKALADYGTDIYGTSYPVFFEAWKFAQMSVLMSYFMVPIVKTFSMTSVTIRIPTLLISCLSLIVLYKVSRDIFGRKTGLSILFFAAIAPWHIMQSRWALEANFYPHFFLFGVYFLNRSLTSRHRKLLLCISMVMFGLCMYCYGVSIYTMPLFLVLACVYLLLKKKVSIGEALMAMAVWLAVSWPFILVMAINYFGWDTVEIGPVTLQNFKDSVRAGDILFFSDDIIRQLFENIKTTVSVVFLQGDDLPWNNIPMYGSIYKFSLPVVLLGLGWLVTQLKKNSGAALIFFMWLTGLWCGIITNEVNINRINIIFYAQIVFLGLGVAFLMRNTRGLLRFVPAAVYLLSFALFARCYFDPYNSQAQSIERYFYKYYGQALTEIRDSDADKIYITAEAHGIQTSEVLTMFYHELDAEYCLGKTEPENVLPYKERYVYGYLSDMEIDESENAVYLAAVHELKCFNTDLYDIQQFGPYYYVLDRK